MTNSTDRRVPRMIGFPTRIAGSAVIRSSQFMVSAPVGVLGSLPLHDGAAIGKEDYPLTPLLQTRLGNRLAFPRDRLPLTISRCLSDRRRQLIKDSVGQQRSFQPVLFGGNRRRFRRERIRRNRHRVLLGPILHDHFPAAATCSAIPFAVSARL